MARIVKDADERRVELLEVALELFETDGFDRTSVDRIAGEVGIAKGTFYHYFESKQDLLAQLVADYADRLFVRLERELAAMDGDALARFRAFFVRSSEMKLEDRDQTMAVGRSLFAPENLPLRHALMQTWLGRIDDLLADIVADGAAAGIFHVDDPRATAVVLGALWYGWGERQAELVLSIEERPEVLAEVQSGLVALESSMERILGVEQGTLGLGLGGAVAKMAEQR